MNSFYKHTIQEVQHHFQSAEDGLLASEAAERLLKYGKNVLIEKKKNSVWVLLLHQFKELMILILLVAAGISMLAGEVSDAIVIGIIVLLNACIGFVQEYRAGKAMEALKQMAAQQALVIRNGQRQQIPASDLVPGDRVYLEAGMVVPADIRLTEIHALTVEEAALTGESNPVEKITEPIPTDVINPGDQINMVFKSTKITYGRGVGIVVATGMSTEIGRIALLLQEQDTQTPLQLRLARFGKKLSVVVFVICIILVIAGWLRGEALLQLVLTAISVAVAAIPEALPAVITIALALGARRMVQVNALIRKLPAVETLGSVNFICTDKTGTITLNQMTVTDIWFPQFKQSEWSGKETLLLSMNLNHDVVWDENKQPIGDPTEVALAVYAQQHLDTVSFNLASDKRVFELPFDSDRKRMTTVHAWNEGWLVVTKGAVERILEICESPDVKEVDAATARFAQNGKRVLAYAISYVAVLPESKSIATLETRMTLTGLVALMDPPRKEAIQAIADCHQAGITPVMITGDHPLTALAIARQTGIIHHETDRLLTGIELTSMDEETLSKDIHHIKVYARVSPEQKLRIVKALQSQHHFVAMTGDGVNDAPALKQADIGIAMGITGSDVSKEASDMILLDDHFATIVNAIREGRRIYDNIRKFVKYVLTCNSGEIWLLFLAPILGLPIPLLPIHILWINLVTDGLPGLALASEKAEHNILKRPPRPTNESIFAGGMAFHIFWVGLLMGLVCLGTQSWAIQTGKSHWQTMVFTILSISQLGHAMAIRSESVSLFKQGVFGNIQLVVSVIFTLILQFGIIYIPFFQNIFHTETLSLNELMLCLVLSAIVFWAVEAEKLIKRNFYE